MSRVFFYPLVGFCPQRVEHVESRQSCLRLLRTVPGLQPVDYSEPGTRLFGWPSQFSAAGITVGCIMSGTKILAARPTSRPENSRGATTAMIVNGVPDRWIVLPRTDGSRSNRRSQ